MRYFRIGNIGALIDESMALFLDEKDMKSSIILSHIYLLIGFSYPLWISNLNS